MKLSVVIPARNASAHLDHLLLALLPQLSPQDECVVVDDASTDSTGEIARRHGVDVVKKEGREGPAASRNEGAARTTGNLLVFLDADVVPHAGLLQQMREQMDRFPEIAALMGSYDELPSDTSLVSRFRNLLHCYTHRNGSADASTFWAGCGAIRREEFNDANGFDAAQFPEPSIEDIELGVRLKQQGKKIRLDPTLQVQHRKVWTLPGMVRTDICYRAIPWTRLILKSGNMPRDLNLVAWQRVSGAAVAMACLLLPLSAWFPMAGVVGVVSLALVVVLNLRFYRFLAANGGWWFAARSIPLHMLYFACSVLGYAVAWVGFRFKGDD